MLLAEGFVADDRGRGLEPQRTIVWITEARAAQLVNARPLVLRLDAELLGARCLALVPFPESHP